MTQIQRCFNNCRFALLILIGGVVALRSEKPVSAEPKPGELLEIRVDTPSGPMVVRFRYCPPGEVLRGKPQALPEPTGNALLDRIKRKALLAELKGFYIGETEVSQQQFEFVSGKQTVENIIERMGTGESGGRGNEFPIRGVTVFEATDFCESLSELDGVNQRGRSSLEAPRFRLPTHDEWQYASRAIGDVAQTKTLPHYNAWPQEKDVPKDVIADCNDVWRKKLGEKTRFDGSQDQVLRVIEAHDNPRRGVEILSAFLRSALGTERSYAINETQPQPVGSGKQNNWNIFNMHGNVFEWTIAKRAPDRFELIWDMLTAGDAATLTAEGSKAFFLAGGGYNHSLDQTVSDWIKFSIWGGRPMKEGEADSYSFSDLETLDIAQDTSPGFRVLLEGVLAKDWLFVIREDTIMNEKDNLKDIQVRLGEHRRLVADLSTGSDHAVARARIDFYEALENYRKGNRTESARLLSAASDSLSEEDSFFEHFQKLVATDAK